MQRWCRGAGAEDVQVQRCRGAVVQGSPVQVQRGCRGAERIRGAVVKWCTGAVVQVQW